MINKRSFEGALHNRPFGSLKYDFAVSYPIRKDVFFTNTVMQFNNRYCLIHPYIGIGLGVAVAKISNANSITINPNESAVNSYDSDFCSNSTFGGQVKLGLIYDLNPRVSIFTEYRWLYVDNTYFTFGSRVNPKHAEIPYWLVTLGEQHHHLANVGIRFIW